MMPTRLPATWPLGRCFEVIVLNLYLVPKSGAALEPAKMAAALAWLADEDIVGAEPTTDGELAPGPAVRRLFHDDALEWLLPAELTFDGLKAVHSGAQRFLPETVDAFEDARCTLCGDTLDVDVLATDLERLLVFPVDRFAHLCPSCRTELTLKEIDFGQPTMVAHDWILVEGAATTRLSQRVLDQLGKLLGSPLVIVPEVFEDADFDGDAGFAPAKDQSRRSRGGGAKSSGGQRKKRGR
jgi:hypothetical protein